MIRRLFWLALIVGVIVVVTGNLSDRGQTNCTATVTGDDGTVQVLPCR